MRFSHLGFLCLTTLSYAGCRATNASKTTVKADGSLVPGVSRPCVFDNPLTSDGYSNFAPVSASRVTRKIMTAQGLVEDPQKTVKPTAEELAATMRRISGVVDKINDAAPVGSPNRRVEIYRQSGGTPEPYCLFHAPGSEIYGTVILFHGFNDRPQQQAALGTYLFHSGFNVYNVFLANHWRVPGTAFWPKTVYKQQVIETVVRKAAIPANQARLAPLKPHLESGQITPEDIAVIDSVLGPELSSTMIINAWKDPGGRDFKALFNFNDGQPDRFGSGTNGAEPLDFLAFVRDAQDRLEDLRSMPGPVFISGLSVGGAIVLGLAEADGGQRVRGVVSQAAWLRSVNDETQKQVMIAGPLDDKIKNIGGQYPISWPNHQIEFSPASIAANAALGSYVTRPDRVQKLAMIPNAFITTAVDVSADNRALKTLFDAMNQGPLVGYHQYVQYPADKNVGHALTDPENYRGETGSGADGNHWNMYWRTLYQEIFRFYTTGKIDNGHFQSKDQDPALPRVECAITGEFAYRCGM